MAEACGRQIAYLQTGTDRQREAYRTLADLRLFERLAAFTPVLAGTIPLDIDLPGSDLDIICQAADLDHFAALVRAAYGDQPDFRVTRKEVGALPTVIARFTRATFPIELFAQDRPVQEQNAYRHMIAEARLLASAGPGAKEAIRALKAGGLKTEPAFAAYFNLPGDPYEALLKWGE